MRFEGPEGPEPALIFWKAYLSIKQPLTAHDPIHSALCQTDHWQAARCPAGRRGTKGLTDLPIVPLIIMMMPTGPSGRSEVSGLASVLSPSPEPALMELWVTVLFEGSIGGAPVLGTHALPGFQLAGPDPA